MLTIIEDVLRRDGREVFYLLDDVHFISSPKLPELIAFLCDHMPKKLHLVLMSRNNIFNMQADFKIGSRRCGLDADDLRLSERGLLTYAKRCGMKLTAQQAHSLIEQTEGWFAIVYLNLRTYLKDGHWLDSSESVYAVLDEVLFRSLPERQAEFLVRMGLPDSFTGEEAAWLWEEGDAAEILEALTQQNAFITRRGDTYRYHNMLSACARGKFAGQPKEKQDRQLLRLGQWYAKAGDYYPAELCFERCGAWAELLEAVFDDHAWAITGENCAKLLEWCRLCPEDILKANPNALLVLMRKLFSFGQVPEMLRMQKLLMSALEENDALSQCEKDNYRGECQLVMSFTAYNDIAAMSRYHRAACALMTRTALNIDPHGYWTFGAPSVLMMFHRETGMADAENATMRECMPYYYQVTDYHGNGAEHVMQAETDFLRGSFTDAELSCQFAISAARRTGQYSILAPAHFTQMQMQVFSGDFEGAVKQLSSLRELLVRERQYYLLYTLELMRSWLYALVGKTAEDAPAWLTDETQPSPLMRPALPMLEIVRNQVLLADGQWAAVAAREKPVSAMCEGYHALLCAVWLEIQLSAAYDRLGKRALAAEHLQKAMDAAAPDGLLLPFVFCCDYVSIQLRELAARKQYSDVIEKNLALSALFRESKAKILHKHWNAAPDYGLTEQELETARLAATAMPLSEIAASLFVSEGTVKNRLTVVYEKLGLTGRNKRLALSKLFDGAQQ